MEKVSVIIPAYNAQKEIEKCLLSVCDQTYKNLEVLIINDGSTDQTGEICRKYAQEFQTLKVIDTDNRGVSAARNTGLSYAQGEYIFFLDADDILEKDAVSILMEHRYQGELIIGNYRMIDVLQKNKADIHKQYFEEEIHKGTKEELPCLCNFRNFHCIWGKLYRKDLIEKYQISFDENMNYGEDLVFNMEYFQYVNSFVIMNKIVYNYCYKYGEGLGTRFIRDEWEIQKKLCGKMQEMILYEYNLSDSKCKEMNHFYYAQAIAVLDRIAQETTLCIKERKTEIRKITESDFFKEILEKEYYSGRLKKVDWIMLYNHRGLLYHKIHRFYVALKEVGKRKKVEKEN